MEQSELKRALEAILFAAGEPVETERLSKALECDPDEIDLAARELIDELSYDRRGVRIVHLGKAYQMCSSGEMAEYITKALETRKPPKLSPSQLETLTEWDELCSSCRDAISNQDTEVVLCSLLHRRWLPPLWRT